MFKGFANCKDRTKCAFIGLATLLACVVGAASLTYFDSGAKRANLIDGIRYDHNPWTTTAN